MKETIWIIIKNYTVAIWIIVRKCTLTVGRKQYELLLKIALFVVMTCPLNENLLLVKMKYNLYVFINTAQSKLIIPPTVFIAVIILAQSCWKLFNNLVMVPDGVVMHASKAEFMTFSTVRYPNLCTSAGFTKVLYPF